MTGVHPEIIILIDTSAFNTDTKLNEILMGHVKEAVSYQISRGTITNKKLRNLKVEPYVSRVKWRYIFFDSTSSDGCKNNSEFEKRPKLLTYECWNLFEKDLEKNVNLCPSSKNDTQISEKTRIKNVVKVLENLKFDRNEPCSHPGPGPSEGLSTSQSLEKFIIVFTKVPKQFSCLVHLAVEIIKSRHLISAAGYCIPENIEICLVDLNLDSECLKDHTGFLGKLPCFWDQFYNDSEQDNYENQLGKKLSLKIECLKKIVMIHKVMEMRYPWMYDHSSPFTFGLGLNRLKQWEWRIPKKFPKDK